MYFLFLRRIVDASKKHIKIISEDPVLLKIQILGKSKVTIVKRSGFLASKNTPITVARGDGIGPEIMEATLAILKGGGARLDIEEIEIGEKVYLRGNPAGIEPSAWESLRRTKVFLKAPITTPQGGGFKSLNVTTRKAFGLYANIRPCLSYNLS